MNRFHPKGYKNPQQIKAIKAKQEKANRPVVTFASEEETKKAIEKAREELRKNIPNLSDSNKVVQQKRKRFNELSVKLARLNGVKM